MTSLYFAVLLTCTISCQSPSGPRYNYPSFTPGIYPTIGSIEVFSPDLAPPPGKCLSTVKLISEDEIEKTLDAGGRVFRIPRPVDRNPGWSDALELREVKRVEKPRVFEIIDEEIRREKP